MNNVAKSAAVLAVILIFAGPAGSAEQAIQTNDTQTTNEEQAIPKSQPGSANSGTATSPVNGKRFVAKTGDDGIQRVEIRGGSFYFDPNDIVVKVNVPVELKVRKESGVVSHDIEVKAPEAGIDFKTKLGTDWKTIRFTPTKVGKYEMFCDERFLWFKSHKDRGMDGWIEVVP